MKLSPKTSSPAIMLLAAAIIASSVNGFAGAGIPSAATPSVIVSTTAEPVTPGKFQPTWESLSQYEVPDWFRDAKFGIWAHWGPQCQPEAGDWYARGMYEEGSKQYQLHLKRYGHPSKSGFKDVIHDWKAEKWDPAKLVALYKRVGAQYFFAMANHHDNLDMWDSKYQPWNSVAVGPKKNIIAGWAKAAHDNGLPFGISVHAAHAFMFYEPAQGSDKKGPLAGIPYDGRLTRADGKGQWWDGLDPADLYAQNHQRGNPDTKSSWRWGNGSSQPDLPYCQKFYNRTMDLINKYHPDLLYFDDTALPLWPVSDAGLKLAAHFYNDNMSRHNGKLESVLFGKSLEEDQRRTMTLDIERNKSEVIEPLAWQTDTCIGSWHYDRERYEKGNYKSATEVVHLLADIVSKNGNLLLNIPVRGDGSIDDKETRILEGIADWMDVNKESIFGTRPWKVFGEGAAQQQSAKEKESQGRPFSTADVRFTTKGNILYAIVLSWPENQFAIGSLGKATGLFGGPIGKVSLLGSPDSVKWAQTDAGLIIQTTPAEQAQQHIAAVFKITP